VTSSTTKDYRSSGTNFHPREERRHVLLLLGNAEISFVDMADNRSCKSRSSHHTRPSSRASSTSSAADAANAKAEAAKARLSFFDRELKMKMDLERLQFEKETAAIIAEAEYHNTVRGEREPKPSHLNFDLAPVDPGPHIRRYLAEQSNQCERPKSEVEPPWDQENSYKYCERMPGPSNQPHPLRERNPILDAPPVISYHSPASYTEPGRPRNDGQHADRYTSDLVRYLTRRELVTSGLTQFSDRPEDYRVWSQSFRNLTGDLGLSPIEEINLLIKWLGRESGTYARRIRSVHLNHPAKALMRIWDRLRECYGAPEVIEDALFDRLEKFQKLASRDPTGLRKYGDLLTEVLSAKEDGGLHGLAYLDTARGLHPLAAKLPLPLQEKWLSVGFRYKDQHRVPIPPFTVFVDFVTLEARIRNDPSFKTDQPASRPPPYDNKRRVISANKTEVSPTNPDTPQRQRVRDLNRYCPLHQAAHPLAECRAFREKPLTERKAFILNHGICFRCCRSTSHLATLCNADVTCGVCSSPRHNTILHPGSPPWTSDPRSNIENGGEGSSPTAGIVTKCTQVCGGDLSGKSCSKIVLVEVYPVKQPDKAIRTYAIVDDQSNRSLASSDFFDTFSDDSPSYPYSLKTCAGVLQTTGRRARGFQVKSIDGEVSFPLPDLVECDEIPDDRSSIPTPEAALHHPHLRPIANLIPGLEPNTPIILLLGRDILRAHKVRRQINGPHNAPYAHKLDLGWVIVGDVCLRGAHRSTAVATFRTHILEGGRPTLSLKPCPVAFRLKEDYREEGSSGYSWEHLGCDVFRQTKDDEKPAPSIEDLAFLDIMDRGVERDEDNSWIAPLPFRSPRYRLPRNRTLAEGRLSTLRRSLSRKPEMEKHFLSFMEKLFNSGHAEPAPPLREGEECWYLPIFGVYHPKKPGKIRVVFDSSAKFNGTSLNDALITGPDLNNTLIGVLIRFRREPVAITADIEQMFHCFRVKREHRNFLRFLWYRDNNPAGEITEYRMRVHVFGNSPSPAVAIYCLRRAVKEDQPNYDPAVEHLVRRDFYIDDCLRSFPTEEAAISLLRRTKDTLTASNLRLHKIASNRKGVLAAFPSLDHASDLRSLDLSSDDLPTQRSLGLEWNIREDAFTFRAPVTEKPFTRRGVLSTLNSLYDRLGFAAPVTIQGKFILRDLTDESGRWDSPLPKEMLGLGPRGGTP